MQALLDFIRKNLKGISIAIMLGGGLVLGVTVADDGKVTVDLTEQPTE